MLIIEGVDGSGKSNLVGRLCQEFDMDCEEKVVDKDTNPIGGISLKEWVENDLRHWPKAAIYDRHRLISEPIYAPIMRGRLADGFEDPIWFTKHISMFWKARPVIIYCMPPPEVVAVNVANEETENETVCQAIAPLYWLYHINYCQNASRPNVLIWDYTQDDYADLLHYIKYILKEEFSRHADVINRYFPIVRSPIETPAQDETGRKRSKGFGRR